MPPTCPFGISRPCKPPCPGPPWTIFCQTPAVYCRQLRSPQAAHVHVPHSKLLSCQTLTAADLELHCSGGSEESGGEAASRHMRRLAGAGLALLHQLLGALGALGPGRYLLAHAPGEPTCCLFKALSEEAAEAVEVTGRGARGHVGCAAAAAHREGSSDSEKAPCWHWWAALLDSTRRCICHASSTPPASPAG